MNTFTVLCGVSFYSNETVKYSWSDSQGSSEDVVHVFMSSFSEAADAEVTVSATRFSLCVVNETNYIIISVSVIHSFRDDHVICVNAHQIV